METDFFNEEQERRELIEAAELGRKYEAANEVLDEIIAVQRANIVRSLESGDIVQDNDGLGLVLYLRVLKTCENLIRSKIDAGKLADEDRDRYIFTLPLEKTPYH